MTTTETTTTSTTTTKTTTTTKYDWTDILSNDLSILILYHHTKDSLVLNSDGSKYKIWSMIFSPFWHTEIVFLTHFCAFYPWTFYKIIFYVYFNFQAGAYWGNSSTDEEPKFTVHAQRFWWVKCGFSEAKEITRNSWLRLGNVVSNLKEG